ncbi:sigma-70 family RNA polymerase sigma factor [Psychromonas sp. KJ10-10]|uniref:sigma-70 family RNA polymerase sigma factor n=1 Tax=Psychromonas sp. KJ10-10 TaxID=3391823 RepID=UPI0039B52FF3
MHCLMTAWNENEQLVKNWLLKQTADKDLTQDLLQDLFIKAMKNKERFCELDDAKSWLFKVAKNTLIDDFRKTKLEIGEVYNEFEDENIETPLVNLQQCLIRVISELDEEDKNIIEQCDMFGLSQQEYAQKHHLSLPATKSRIQRARKKLRQQMVTSCNVQFSENKVCCFTPR